MISESEALASLLASVPQGAAVESLPLASTLARRCAVRHFASVALPGFDNSMMDGYAVRAAETRDPEPLLVIGTQPAGRDLQLALTAPRQAVRIFTGAPIPSGADAVIMQEDVSLSGDHFTCREPVAPGENIRLRGGDLCPGQLLLQPGDLVTPGRIGLLASQGLTHLPVFRPPSIAIVSTGDELVPPGSPVLLPGQLFNSNAPMLAALLAELGLPVAETAHAPDSLEQTVDALGRLADSHEVILLSGGVSVGDKDHVKPALARLGLPPHLWRVRVKPGKPFLFSHRPGPRPLWIFGLPGNPVSAFVTFQILVRPALLKWTGAPPDALSLPSEPAVLAAPLSNPGDRPHYLRGCLANGRFQPSSLQRSDALFSLSQANALLRLDPGACLEAGAAVLALRC